MKLMKKVIFCTALILLLAAGSYAWYVYPVEFLDNVSADEVACISIFDGQNGTESSVTDKSEIYSAVSRLRGVAFKRSGISLGKMGYRYKLTFYGNDGNQLDAFIVNSDGILRKDPFFYKAIGG